MPSEEEPRQPRPSWTNAIKTRGLHSWQKLQTTVASLSLEVTPSFGTTGYQYLPLDRERKEIRLLSLEPGSGTDPIRCTLEHAFLDTSPPPRYETISYVCGDPTRKRAIFLHDMKVRVLETSRTALYRMRLPDARRTLWIDAICIDQSDDDERGHQVGMMYVIYTNTFRNLIWLGPDDGSTAKAIETMGAILREYFAETQGSAHPDDFLFDAQGNLRHSDAAFPVDVEDSSLYEFFAVTWFTRLWVVQEALLAPDSICHRGDFAIPLAGVVRVAIWMRYKWQRLPVMPYPHLRGSVNCISMYDGRIHARNGRRNAAMLNCMASFKGFLTYDPRDRNFAILGLWQQYTKASELPSALKPDYKCSTSKVFRNATRYAICECGNLSPLRLVINPVTSPQTQGDKLPSWVPRFEWTAETSNVPTVAHGLFQADNESSMVLSDVGDRPNALIVNGIFVDEVTKIIPTATLRHGNTTLTADTSAMADMEHLGDECWVTCPPGGAETKVGSVLLSGVIRGGQVTDADALLGYQRYKKYLKDHGPFKNNAASHETGYCDEEKVAAQYNDGLYHATWDKVAFHTKDGHVGLGPEGTKVGDIVAIFYGLQVPVMLRPLHANVEYHLLGMSYVYGIMDGEAVRRHKARDLSDTVFCMV